MKVAAALTCWQRISQHHLRDDAAQFSYRGADAVTRAAVTCGEDLGGDDECQRVGTKREADLREDVEGDCHAAIFFDCRLVGCSDDDEEEGQDTETDVLKPFAVAAFDGEDQDDSS